MSTTTEDRVWAAFRANQHYVSPEAETAQEERIRALQATSLETLIASGDVERCIVCGGLSAYCFWLTDEGMGEERGVAPVGSSSCWEWECGHCRAHHVQADAPILAECYTHQDPDEGE